jgi:hypothetical protein
MSIESNPQKIGIRPASTQILAYTHSPKSNLTGRFSRTLDA